MARLSLLGVALPTLTLSAFALGCSSFGEDQGTSDNEQEVASAATLPSPLGETCGERQPCGPGLVCQPTVPESDDEAGLCQEPLGASKTKQGGGAAGDGGLTVGATKPSSPADDDGDDEKAGLGEACGLFVDCKADLECELKGLSGLCVAK